MNSISTRKREARVAGRPAAPVRRRVGHARVPRAAASLPPARRSFPVIAMAASVGGLKALSVILGGLPPGFPAAIAIVMHLSPDRKSLLAGILGSRSSLEVREAKSGDFLCPACVFVAPPNHHLSVARDGRLELSSPVAEKVHHSRPSAEPLFASVAAVYQRSAIAVVLTGGDGDGSFGVQTIKDQGGMVIAQDCPTSEDFSMPQTSIQTGDVDFILPLADIAPKLMELVAARMPAPERRSPIRRVSGVLQPLPERRPALRGQSQAAPAPAKRATRHYPAATKGAMMKRSK